jgi:hypothetical protein
LNIMRSPTKRWLISIGVHELYAFLFTRVFVGIFLNILGLFVWNGV